MVGLYYTVLLVLAMVIASSSVHVALTASSQCVTRGREVRFDCVFVPNGPIPTYFRLVLTLQGRTLMEIRNDRMKWWSTGGIHYTELVYTTSKHQDETYNCTASFGEPPRQHVSDTIRVPVCCPLRIESRRLIVDIIDDIYGLDITVSGNDVGGGAVIPSNTDTPITVDVTSSVISGRFQLGQTRAKLFSIRWRMRQDWDGSCADQGGGSNDYTLRVYQLLSFIDEPFEILYPAQWNRRSKWIHIAEGDRYNKTIQCDVCANPPPTIAWSLCGKDVPNDVIISQSGVELIIPEVLDHHVGVYVCAATNTIFNQQLKKTFEIKLSINGSQTDPLCDSPTNTAVWISISVACAIAFTVACLIVTGIYCRRKRQQRKAQGNSYEDIDGPGLTLMNIPPIMARTNETDEVNQDAVGYETPLPSAFAPHRPHNQGRDIAQEYLTTVFTDVSDTDNRREVYIEVINPDARRTAINNEDQVVDDSGYADRVLTDTNEEHLSDSAVNNEYESLQWNRKSIPSLARWLTENQVSSETFKKLQEEKVMEVHELKSMTKKTVRNLDIPVGEQIRLWRCIQRLPDVGQLTSF